MEFDESNDLIEAIKSTAEPEHDTVYCSAERASGLKEAVYSNGPGLRKRTIDTLKISGLNVEVIPSRGREFPAVIVCQKGDVFSLAKDFKNGREPKDI